MVSMRHVTVRCDVDFGVSTSPLRSRALARMATTGIYLLRGVSRGIQRSARARAASEGTSLRWVLVQALREYAAGTWTPRAVDTVSESPRAAGPHEPSEPAWLPTEATRP
jgi:hypothetical protein